MVVCSLFDCALHAVMRDFTLHERQIYAAPRNVKTKLVKSVTKRGLFDERNMTLVSNFEYYNIYILPTRAQPMFMS